MSEHARSTGAQTRRSFMARSALATATLCGVTAVAPFVAQAAGAGAGDADVLQFLLHLELLQQDLLTTRAGQVHLGPKARATAHRFGLQEGTHVMAVMTALSDVDATAAAAAKPTATFAAAHDEASFLRLAAELEDTVVRAYNGLLPSLSSKVALAQTGAVLQVDARHAAAFLLLRHDSPTPYGAFDTPLSRSDARARLARL